MTDTEVLPTSSSPIPTDDETHDHPPSSDTGFTSSENPFLSHSPEPTDDDDESMLTVFDNPSSFNVKHPLQNRWTLWFDNPQKRTGMHNWEKSLKNLITFDTVEDFWGVYNNIVNSSQLAHGANYHLFKEGVRPMWEDPMNENGGKWVVPLPKGKRDNLDDYWLHTMLACVGENFPDSDEICGAVVSIRKQQDRLALWTRNALKEDETKAAGTIWKTVLQLPDSETIGYQAHSDALKKNSSFSNSDMYIV